ncbi:MAG: hypothetical protein A2X86_13515 [Bdellovibrionales bacterium GWA2_49_15]|nr:MAG: hypothetical protein A2X86_13515 [Bdellovibrionales bacterium GWA2_49_15]HAZ13544.1 hypothetical protein [Bdellovibrionales bacterium]
MLFLEEIFIMMAFILRLVLFFCLYQLFRSFLRRPKRIKSYRSRAGAQAKSAVDEGIVEADYRVIKE